MHAIRVLHGQRIRVAHTTQVHRCLVFFHPANTQSVSIGALRKPTPGGCFELDYEIVGREVISGKANDSSVLSKLTAASMEDLGYIVDPSAVGEPFSGLGRMGMVPRRAIKNTQKGVLSRFG